MAKPKVQHNSDEQEVLNMLLSMFAIDSQHRAQYEAEVLRGYRQFLAYVDESITGRANLFIPRTYQQADTTRSRLMKALFNNAPYVGFVPKVGKNTDLKTIMLNKLKSQIPAALVNQQLEKNEIQTVAWDFFTSMMFAKAGILSVGWRYETRKVRKYQDKQEDIRDEFGNVMDTIEWKSFDEVEDVVWDDNEVQNVDWFDFWPDSRGRNWNPNTWRHAWHRDWATKERIEAKLNVLKRLKGGTVYEINETDWDRCKAASASLQEGRGLRLAEIGKTAETRDSAQVDTTGQTSDSVLYEVLYYWTNDGKMGMIIGETKLAYYGETPYQRHKMIPFLFLPYEPLPNEVQGRSYCDWLYHQQEELNTNHNQRIDNRSMIINNEWITTDADLPETLVSRPNAVHKVMDINGLVPLKKIDTTRASVEEEMRLIQQMEETMGTPAISQGNTAQRDQTATEVVTQNSNATARFDVRINLFQAAFKRLWQLMDMNNQQFMTDTRLVEIADQEGISAWREVGIDDISGEWDYVPGSANVDPFVSKELKRQQLIQYIQIAQQLQLPVNIEELNKELISTFDFGRNNERFIPTPEQMAEQQQRAMAAQNQQAQVAMAQQQQADAAKLEMTREKMMVDLIKTIITAYAGSRNAMPMDIQGLSQVEDVGFDNLLQAIQSMSQGAEQSPSGFDSMPGDQGQPAMAELFQGMQGQEQPAPFNNDMGGPA